MRLPHRASLTGRLTSAEPEAVCFLPGKGGDRDSRRGEKNGHLCSRPSLWFTGKAMRPPGRPWTRVSSQYRLPATDPASLSSHWPCRATLCRPLQARWPAFPPPHASSSGMGQWEPGPYGPGLQGASKSTSSHQVPGREVNPTGPTSPASA